MHPEGGTIGGWTCGSEGKSGSFFRFFVATFFAKIKFCWCRFVLHPEIFRTVKHPCHTKNHICVKYVEREYKVLFRIEFDLLSVGYGYKCPILIFDSEKV